MRLYSKYFSVTLRCAMQYKISFFLTITGQFLSSFSVLIGMYFMFSRFNKVEGFTFNEVLLAFAIVLMSHAVAECFATGVAAFKITISNGDFDRIMLRPQNEIFQVLANKIDMTRLGRFVEAAVILAYAIPSSRLDWTVLKAVTLTSMFLGGVALFSGLFIVNAAVCFFTIEGLEFMNIFTYGGRDFGRYPLSVYGKRVLQFLTFIVPLACVQYYPLLFLLGRTTNAWFAAAPLCGIVFVIPCYAFWRLGVRHYKSTGS